MALNGVDISSNNSVDVKKIPYDFCIVKATQGTTYINPDFYKIDTVLGMGKLAGCYHYVGGGGAAAEAKFFYNKVKKYIGKAIMAIDWESVQNSAWNDVTYLKTLMDEFYRLSGVKPFLYTSKSIVPLVASVGSAGYPLWCAQYASNNTVYGYQSKPWTDGGSFGTFGKAVIHQYTGAGRLSGYNSNLDLNIFYGTAADWKKYAQKTGKVAEAGKSAGATAGDSAAQPVTAGMILGIFRNWINNSNAHTDVVNTYNSHKPLALGYTLSMYNAWCDATVSAAFIKANAVDLIGGTECGVERHTKLFKAAGIWNEDGNITPKAGDIIVFNWDDDTQPNDGFSDHIGIVEAVTGKTITTIEGNSNNAVRRCYYTVGDGNIRGYARPKYGAETKKDQSSPETAESGNPKISYSIKTRNHGTLAFTGNGYPLGIANDSILQICIKVSSGSVQYRVHHHNRGWSKKVNGGTWIGDGVNSLDAIQIYYSTDVSKTGGRYYEAVYSVKPYDRGVHLPEVHDTTWEKSDGDQTAGIFGKPFTEVKMRLAKA